MKRGWLAFLAWAISLVAMILPASARASTWGDGTYVDIYSNRYGNWYDSDGTYTSTHSGYPLYSYYRGLEIYDGYDRDEVIEPGSPFHAYVLEYTYASASYKHESNTGSSTYNFTSVTESNLSSGTTNTTYYKLSAGAVTLEKTETWADSDTATVIKYKLTNNGSSALSSIRFALSYDPDQDAFDYYYWGYGYYTYNDAVDTDSDGKADFAQSEGWWSYDTVGYGACDETKQDVGHTSSWDPDADATYYDYAGYEGDYTHHIRHKETSLSASSSVEWAFIHVFGTSASSAQSTYKTTAAAKCTTCTDSDGDGYTASSCGGTDCNDSSASVNPGATETCNGVDDDCDGTVDDGVKTTYYRDADGDGYGTSTTSTTACSAPSGYVANSTDCDDASASDYPGASETVNNGDDEDCDGVDSCYQDADNDDYGTTTVIDSADLDCTDAYEATVSTDCNDSNSAIKPSATETCNGVDDDCDGSVDEGVKTTYYRDADGDGYGTSATSTTACSAPSGYVTSSTDCDDTKSSVSPVATEVCDSIDNDCDGSVDEGVKTTYYRDADSDGYGTSSTTTTACSAPSGYVASSTDCNDADKTIYPGATETCNGKDDDCDGTTDEGVKTTYYRDADGDGYGTSATTSDACSAPSGYVANKTDCDDTSASDYPGASETVNNGDDEDCDGVDSCYQDSDKDTYGSTTVVDSLDLDCSDSGESGLSTDCNDAAASISPAATEVCNGIDDDCDGSTDEGVTKTYYRDADGDGYGVSTTTSTGCSAPAGYVTTSGDCNDASTAANPGATEVCDSIDNDCDGSVDEGVKTTYYLDSDGDGYGVATTTTSACSKPSGYATVSTDCNDSSSTVYPGAPESCNSIDDDCDGTVDDGVTTTWYKDGDGDGYGSTTSVSTCTPPSGYVANKTDCDDADKLDYPGATETVNNGDDEDCDGVDSCYQDSDKDGYGSTTVVDSLDLDCSDSGEAGTSSDCNDSNAAVSPGATETCNSIDDDCDGSIDEGVTTTYYKDSDGDGYGTSSTSTTACSAPAGYVTNSTDCNDASASIKPGATETCNGVDDDCDGSIDEGVKITYYRDADSDGYGTSATTTTACSAPAGYVTSSTDCNDASATVYPGATETCNSVDDDCDGTVDEGVKTTYYRDADSDGYGTSTTTTTACSAPSGYVANSTDCDDTKSTVNPGASESCNGVDDDCDGTIDEGVKTTYYRDADGDGYGRSTSSTTACSAPTGYVANSTDCDDTRSTVNPGATEYCNGRDDDCDGTTDEDSAADASTWYRDSDGDGYGDATSSEVSCTAPTGFVSTSTDCDDTRATVYPGATETCNSRDDDCDGSVDEGVTTTYYKDSDGDGYGGTSSTTGCSRPTGYVSTSTDCDDTKSTVNPGATETCNSVDDDCDGTVDEGVKTTYYRDADGDSYGWASTTTDACSAPTGYVANKTDCDDTSASDYPGASETVNNGDDEDCDGVDSCYQDLDKDAYGSTTVIDSADLDCTDSGESGKSTDCSDSDATTYPGATEICDGIDNDCDGSIDEGATGMGTWYADADADGYGDPASSTASCSKPSGYVNNKTDCDDTAATINPAATEYCNGKDDDCDGTIDESSAADASTWYDDDDGDGYGDAADTALGCSAPSGYVASSTDCDDTRATVYPGAAEACNGLDDDCDGTVDDGVKTTYYADADSDGYGNVSVTSDACSAPSGYVADDTDCDDAAATVFPGASETCNDVDDDCDGTVDEGATDALTWYADADGDAYGNAASTTASCDMPTGYVANDDDCNDSNAAVSPADPELCNGIDDNCDGTIDGATATDASTWYADADSDGYGDASTTTKDCSKPSGYVADSTDCDDTDAAVSPADAEICNGNDDDCDGVVDEPDATDALTWYADADSDGYGDASTTTPGCDQPSGYVADSTDCDDTNAAISPADVEVCNDLDDDCDGVVDDAAIDADTWYADADEDGYGDAASTTAECDVPSGYVADSTDCDDTDATSYPGATDVPYDGIDQDCSGDDLTDADGDGYDAEVVGGTDCDDSDETVYEGAGETADGVDSDCDGTVDEETEWYDDDGDGYTEDGGDCDDATADVAPNGAEDCDGVDDDCDGSTDETTDCYDDDGDGVTEADGDCNDGDGSVSPTATETADNGVDDDCDGSVDGGVFDEDFDGYTEEGGDCVTDDDNSYPGAPETADGVDNDCDGTVDEGTEAYDDDGDGFTELFGDCDDGDAEINGSAAEDPANGRDDDCDGMVDEGGEHTDDDGDGFTEEGGDCDDGDAEIGPGTAETDNDVDDDCDGQIDEDFTDVDEDGYTAEEGDCDDNDGWTGPSFDEMCDGVDNNCNDIVDEGCDGDTPVQQPTKKCGCDSAPSGSLAVLPLIALLALRRRR